MLCIRTEHGCGYVSIRDFASALSYSECNEVAGRTIFEAIHPYSGLYLDIFVLKYLIPFKSAIFIIACRRILEMIYSSLKGLCGYLVAKEVAITNG